MCRFGTYLIAMDQQSYENVGEDTPGNNPTVSVLGWRASNGSPF